MLRQSEIYMYCLTGNSLSYYLKIIMIMIMKSLQKTNEQQVKFVTSIVTGIRAYQERLNQIQSEGT